MIRRVPLYGLLWGRACTLACRLPSRGGRAGEEGTCPPLPGKENWKIPIDFDDPPCPAQKRQKKGEIGRFNGKKGKMDSDLLNLEADVKKDEFLTKC